LDIGAVASRQFWRLVPRGLKLLRPEFLYHGLADQKDVLSNAAGSYLRF
jgi:hypothetical protein